MTITDEQLAEWERLAEAATSGPWEVKEGWATGSAKIYRDDRTIAHWCLTGTAAFIAAARTAVPALIAEVRRLRGNLAEAIVRAESAEQLLRESRGSSTNAWQEVRAEEAECMVDLISAASRFNLVRAEVAERRVAELEELCCVNNVTASPLWHNWNDILEYAEQLEVERDRLKLDADRLRADLAEAIELAQDGIGYAPDYFRDKWNLDGRLRDLGGKPPDKESK